MVAFEDILPKATKHWLVVPKEHIPYITTLFRKEPKFSHEFLLHMKQVGEKLVQTYIPNAQEVNNNSQI